MSEDLPEKEPEISIAACLHPFSTQSMRSLVRPGLSLFQIFNEKEYKAIFCHAHNVFVFVNDDLIEAKDWYTFYPEPGDIISIRVFPMGSNNAGSGSGGKNGGRTAALIGVTLLAIAASIATYGMAATYLGPAVFGAWTAEAAMMGAAIAGTAVSIAGNLLVNALIPIQKAHGPKAEEGKFSITGTRNAIEPYGAVTRVFGKHKQYPKYAALPYTELVGQDSYLRCLFLVGKGKYKNSAHKIGDTAITSYSNVTMEEYFSGDTKSHYALYPDTINESQINVGLTVAAGWQEQTTATNTDEVSLEFSFPSGLCRNKSDGHMGNAAVDFDIQYSPYGQSTWTNVTNMVKLTFSGTPSVSIAVGQTGIGQSSGAQGTVKYAHYTSANVPTGSNDEWGSPIYQYVEFCDYVTIQVTSGTFSQTEVVRFAAAYNATNTSAVSMAAYSVSGQTRTLYRAGYTIPLPRGQWRIQVKRVTADGRQDYSDASYWTVIRSLRHEAPVVQPGCTLIGLRIKATDQLNGVIDQFNLISEAILPTYNGATWSEVVTRNPAWAFCEVLKGNSNERPLADARINLTAVRIWATNCEAAGRTFDYVLDQQTTVWELLKDICAVGRAAPGIIDNKFTVIQDVAQATPIQHFSPRNSWGFKGKRAFPDFPHAFRVSFKNETKDYQQDEIYIYDDGYTSANASKFENLEFRGVVNSDQIWKLARYHIFCVRLRPEVFEFSADVEHMVCTRGDLIRLTHDVIKVGLGQGRVRSMTTGGGNILTLTLDDAFTMGVSGNYGCQFRRGSNATYGTFTVNRVNGDNTTITLSSTLTIGNGPEVGDMVFYGIAGSESILCLVSRIDPGPDLSAKISAVNYDSRIYTDSDTGQIPAWNSGITQDPIVNRTPPPPKIEAYSYSFKTANLNDDGTYGIEMEVVFSAQQTGFIQGGTQAEGGPDIISAFQAQYCIDDGQWITLPSIAKEARNFTFPVFNGSSYDFRIRSLSTPGNYSAWDAVSNVTISIAGNTPANVSGFQVKGGGTAFSTADIEIEWTAVTGGGTVGLRVKDYELKVYTSDGLTLLRTEYVVGTYYLYSWTMNVQDGGPRASIQFKIKARTVWDTLSATATTLTAINAAPAAPASLGNQTVQGGVEFYWNANTERDLKYYQYRTKITSGGTFSAWYPTLATGYLRMLTTAEKVSYGGGATIYIEVKATDIFNQDSSSSASNAVAGSLNIASTDIATFAVTASKVFNYIPIIEGLTLTSNDPSSGRVSWTACTLYYHSTAYSISAGNTPQATAGHRYYIYWKDLNATQFTVSAVDTHPAPTTPDNAVWDPNEDFIIAVNIAGVAQAAWCSIANQVIGSAYIMNAAINDAQVNTLSGSKINASSSVSIGSTTFGNDGIQLEYNGGNPRFYSGDGANAFIKFDGTGVAVRGAITVETGSNVAPGADVTDYADTRIANAISENSTLRINTPIGAAYSDSGNPTTGAIVIHLPQGYTNTMMTFAIDIFQYVADRVFSINIGGYNYNPSWTNCTANLIGSTACDNRVRFGHDNTGKCCVVIGETTSTWSYPKISVRDFRAGHSNYTLDQWNDGWSIEIKSSFSGYGFDIDLSDSLIDAASIKNQGALATKSTIGSSDCDTTVISGGKIVTTLLPVGYWTSPNICHNAAFEAGMFGWTYGVGNLPSTTFGYNLQAEYTLPLGSKGTTPYMYQNNRVGNSGYYSWIQSENIAVTIGKRYCISLYTGALYCDMVIYGIWYTATGTFISSFGGTGTAANTHEVQGGNQLDSFKRCYAFSTAPGNAAYLVIQCYKFDTLAGQSYSFGFFAYAACQEVSDDQTVPPPWAPCDTSIISGGYIRTELLTATNISTGTLNASNVSVTNLNASNISAGTLNVDRLGDNAIAAVKLVAGAATDVQEASASATFAKATITCAGSDKVIIMAQFRIPLGGIYSSGETGASYIPYEGYAPIYIMQGDVQGSYTTLKTYNVVGYGGYAFVATIAAKDTPGKSAGQTQMYSCYCAAATYSSIQVVCCRR